jgi:hypothetical protein
MKDLQTAMRVEGPPYTNMGSACNEFRGLIESTVLYVRFLTLTGYFLGRFLFRFLLLFPKQ